MVGLQVHTKVLVKHPRCELRMYIYRAYNHGGKPKVVHFSDGTRLVVQPRSYGKLEILRLVNVNGTGRRF